MPMSLMEWDKVVRPHLDKIVEGADICATHADRLPLTPGFYTMAEEQMRRCEIALRAALTAIERAQAIYHDKEIER
jgi:hypothetical protein